MREIVAGVLPDDALAPEDAANPPVADAHGHDRHDVGQDEIHAVVARRRRKKKVLGFLRRTNASKNVDKFYAELQNFPWSLCSP